MSPTSPPTFADLLEIGQGQQTVKYGIVLSLALVTADILHTLPEEISLIWQSDWNLGKILFILARYSIFLDMGPAIVYNLSSTLSLTTCMRTVIVASVFTLMGIIIAEVILYLRVFALSGRSKVVGFGLCVIFLGLHGTTAWSLGRYMQSLIYATSPIPKVIGCMPISSRSEDLSLVFILILVSETTILMITCWIMFSKYRQTRSPFITMLYRDGLVYFVLLSVTTAGNIICDLVAPAGYNHLLVTPQRALHSILSARMVLHIRSQNRSTHENYGDIPLSTIRFGVQVKADTKTMYSEAVSDTDGEAGSRPFVTKA